MAHRIAPAAETGLDAIWLYGAQESGSIEVANRLIDSINSRLQLLETHPYSDVVAITSLEAAPVA